MYFCTVRQSSQLRGANLYNELFITPSATTEAKKGRSPHLHARRNQAIADRYFFYGTQLVMRYDIVIARLAEDFFLSTATIQEIVTSMVDYLQQLKRQGISAKELARRWPQYSW